MLVAPYEPEQQEEYLTRAVDNKLTVARRQHIYGKQQDNKSEADRAYAWVYWLEEASQSFNKAPICGVLEIQWLSLLYSDGRQNLADKCHEAATWWAKARDDIRAIDKRVVSKRLRKKKRTPNGRTQRQNG